MKRINQITESRTLIKNAFLKLLETKNYDEITLSEIAKHAQLTRMTLYRHFKSKEEIITLFFTEHLENVMAEIEKIENPNFYDVMCLILETIKANRFIKSSNNSEELHRIYINSLKNYNYNFNERMPLPNLDDVTKNYVMGGINKVIGDWLDNDCQSPSETVAKKLVEITMLVVQAEITKNGGL